MGKRSSSDSHYLWYLDTKMVAISSPSLIVPWSMAQQCFNISINSFVFARIANGDYLTTHMFNSY